MPDVIAAKSGLDLLFKSLNRAAAVNGFSFAATDLDFSPVSVSDNPELEVQVTYTATADSMFEGSAVAQYNRLDLTQLFAGVDAVVAAGPTTAGELVAAINARYGLGFTEADIDFTAPIGAEDTSAVLVAQEGSYGFKGQLLVQLDQPKVQVSEATGGSAVELDSADAQPVDSEPQPE